MTSADVVLVGGGLANSLIAWRLKRRRPELRLCVLERGSSLGGRHLWSHFDSDVTPEVGAWLDPLIVHRWPAYTVAFLQVRRRLSIPYASITSERLHQVIAPELGEAVRFGVDVTEVAPNHVVLVGGERIEAPLVIDGRGPAPSPGLTLGWQKFVGLTLRTVEPHGLAEPVVMDATVDQLDGYRFVYVLPFDERTLLIEDTYYSDGPELDRTGLEARALAYAAARGWRVEAVEGREDGVLPIALAGDIDAFWRAAGPTPRSGLRAALFHPTTGYSLPDAARLADRLADLPELTSAAIAAEVEGVSKALWRDRAFFRLLNRMMFGAARPGERYKPIERFYTLPEPLVRRFYAGDLGLADQARLLVGKPPVPIGAAIRCLPERGFALAAREPTTISDVAACYDLRSATGRPGDGHHRP